VSLAQCLLLNGTARRLRLRALYVPPCHILLREMENRSDEPGCNVVLIDHDSRLNRLLILSPDRDWESGVLLNSGVVFCFLAEQGVR
jgi:hypothetical protein